REIGAPHALEKSAVLALEAIERFPGSGEPLPRHGIGAVEDQRPVWPQAGVYRSGEARDQLQGNALARALVGGGGIREAVADHPVARVQRRHDDADYMIGARGKQQQRLRERLHRLLQDRFAQLLGEIRAAWLARHDDMVSPRAERIRNELDVGRLARAVDSLQGDELAAHAHRPPRWYLLTARLCSSTLREKWLEPSPRET